MKLAVISVADRELLIEFRQQIVDNQLNIGHEFQQEMLACGFKPDHPLNRFFAGLLLDEDQGLATANPSSDGMSASDSCLV